MNAGKLQCVSSVPDREKIFHGIDEHFVFVYHIVQKRIPATFQYNKDFRSKIFFFFILSLSLQAYFFLNWFFWDFKVCGNECAVNQKLQKLGNGASGRNKRKNRQRARRKNRTLYVHKDLDRPEWWHHFFSFHLILSFILIRIYYDLAFVKCIHIMFCKVVTYIFCIRKKQETNIYS